MLTKEAQSRRRNDGHRSLGAARPVPPSLYRLADGSIDYDLFKQRARQLRAAFLAEMISAAGRGLSRALNAGTAVVHQLTHGSPIASHQRR